MSKQEKAVIYFLAGMLVLGLGLKFYRARASRVNLNIEQVNLDKTDLDIQKIIKEKRTVKVNTATKEDFIRLPGIGPALASRIIEYRNQNGNFITIDDLKKVKGIGSKKYEQIKDYLAVE